MRRTLVLVAALAAFAKGAALAQDAPTPADDPVADLRRAADVATGDERPAAWARLAAALETQGLWIEAAQAWREAGATRTTPETAAGEGRALLAFAEEVFAAGESGAAVRGAFEDARIALERARKLGAKDPAVRIGIARCLAADGRVEEQIAELRAAAGESADDPAPRRALGFALYHAARFAESIEVLRPLSDASPSDANLSLTLADAARRSGDETLALAFAGRSIAEHPRDRKSWESVWSVFSAAKRWGELAAHLRDLTAKDPENPLAAHYAGFAAASAQQWDEAIRLLDRAWELDRKNTSARLEAARILFQQKKDRDRTSAYAREVLDLVPDDRRAADLLSFVAQRRSEDGDHAGAVRELESLTKHRPEDVIALSNLAVELKFSGRYEESARAYRRALEVAPGDPQVLNDFGLALAGARRYDEARSVFLEGVAADPGSLDNLENLGWLSRHEGRAEESVSWYRRALGAARARGGDAARFERTLDDLLFPLPPAR